MQKTKGNYRKPTWVAIKPYAISFNKLILILKKPYNKKMYSD